MDNKGIQKQRDFYCVDCDGWRMQKFKRVMPDKTLLYQCGKCGCENSIEIEEMEDNNG